MILDLSAPYLTIPQDLRSTGGYKVVQIYHKMGTIGPGLPPIVGSPGVKYLTKHIRSEIERVFGKLHLFFSITQ